MKDDEGKRGIASLPHCYEIGDGMYLTTRGLMKRIMDIVDVNGCVSWVDVVEFMGLQYEGYAILDTMKVMVDLGLLKVVYPGKYDGYKGNIEEGVFVLGPESDMDINDLFSRDTTGGESDHG